jgi:hypothetical protein
VVAVIVPVFVALLSRRRNKLFFDVVSEVMLVVRRDEDSESNREKTRAKQNSKIGSGRVLFIIDIHNPGWGILSWLGGVDLSPSQYQRKISFSFGEGSRILEADVVMEDPQGIEAEAYRSLPKVDRLVVKPTLLNQGDTIRLRAIVDNPRVESSIFNSSGFFTVRADGRILGIRALQRKRGTQEIFAFWWLTNALAMLPTIVGYIIGLLAFLWTLDPWRFWAWYLATPVPLVEPFTFVTGAQTALLFVAQSLFLMYGLKHLRSRKVATRYSPPSYYPLPL